MTEIALKVTDEQRPPTQSRDGDVLVALSDRSILDKNAELYATGAPASVAFTRHGTRDEDSPLRVYLETTSQFRFDRVSRTELLRTELRTGARHKRREPNLRHWLRRRRTSRRHRIFGKPGSEFWFGGRVHTDRATTARLWSQLEALFGVHAADHAAWSWSPRELAGFLIVTMPETDDEQCARVAASEHDWNPRQPEYDADNPWNLTQLRRCCLADWRDLPGVVVEDVLDQGKPLDLRATVAGTFRDLTVRPRVTLWSVREHLKSRPSLIDG